MKKIIAVLPGVSLLALACEEPSEDSHYNNGEGSTINGSPVQDMCSDLNAVFGRHYKETIYSVIHHRSLEGEPGVHAMERMSKRSGCDRTGALRMEPD